MSDSVNTTTVNIVISPTLEQIIVGIQKELARFGKSEIPEAKAVGCQIATSVASGIQDNGAAIENALINGGKTSDGLQFLRDMLKAVGFQAISSTLKLISFNGALLAIDVKGIALNMKMVEKSFTGATIKARIAKLETKSYYNALKMSSMAALGVIGIIAGLGIAMLATDTSFADIGNKIKEVFSKISEVAKGIASQMPEIMATIGNVIMEVIPQFLQELPGLIYAGTDVLVGLINSFTDMLPGFIETGTQLLIGLIEGFTNALPGVIDKVVGIIPKITDALVSLIPKLVDAGIKLFLALAKAIPLTVIALVDAVISLIMAVVDILPVLIPALLDAAIQLFLALVKALPQILTALIDGAISLVLSVVRMLPTLIPALIEAAITLFLALVQAIPQILVAVLSAIGELIGKVISWITSSQFLKDIAQAGKDLISGLIKGLMDSVGSILSTIKNICGDILNGILGFFGIKSPSKVMQSIGGFISEGLALGIEDKAGMVIDSVSDMVDDVIGELNRDIPVLDIGARISPFDRDAAHAGYAQNVHNTYYTIGDMSYVPDTRVEELIMALFSEVRRTRRTGVYA